MKHPLLEYTVVFGEGPLGLVIQNVNGFATVSRFQCVPTGEPGQASKLGVAIGSVIVNISSTDKHLDSPYYVEIIEALQTAKRPMRVTLQRSSVLLPAVPSQWPLALMSSNASMVIHAEDKSTLEENLRSCCADTLHSLPHHWVTRQDTSLAYHQGTRRGAPGIWLGSTAFELDLDVCSTFTEQGRNRTTSDAAASHSTNPGSIRTFRSSDSIMSTALRATSSSPLTSSVAVSPRFVLNFQHPCTAQTPDLHTLADSDASRPTTASPTSRCTRIRHACKRYTKPSVAPDASLKPLPHYNPAAADRRSRTIQLEVLREVSASSVTVNENDNIRFYFVELACVVRCSSCLTMAAQAGGGTPSPHQHRVVRVSVMFKQLNALETLLKLLVMRRFPDEAVFQALGDTGPRVAIQGTMMKWGAPIRGLSVGGRWQSRFFRLRTDGALQWYLQDAKMLYLSDIFPVVPKQTRSIAGWGTTQDGDGGTVPQAENPQADGESLLDGQPSDGEGDGGERGDNEYDADGDIVLRYTDSGEYRPRPAPWWKLRKVQAPGDVSPPLPLAGDEIVGSENGAETKAMTDQASQVSASGTSKRGFGRLSRLWRRGSDAAAKDATARSIEAGRGDVEVSTMPEDNGGAVDKSMFASTGGMSAASAVSLDDCDMTDVGVEATGSEVKRRARPRRVSESSRATSVGSVSQRTPASIAGSSAADASPTAPAAFLGDHESAQMGHIKLSAPAFPHRPRGGVCVTAANCGISTRAAAISDLLGVSVDQMKGNTCFLLTTESRPVLAKLPDPETRDLWVSAFRSEKRRLQEPVAALDVDAVRLLVGMDGLSELHHSRLESVWNGFVCINCNLSQAMADLTMLRDAPPQADFEADQITHLPSTSLRSLFGQDSPLMRAVTTQQPYWWCLARNPKDVFGFSVGSVIDTKFTVRNPFELNLDPPLSLSTRDTLTADRWIEAELVSISLQNQEADSTAPTVPTRFQQNKSAATAPRWARRMLQLLSDNPDVVLTHPQLAYAVMSLIGQAIDIAAQHLDERADGAPIPQAGTGGAQDEAAGIQVADSSGRSLGTTEPSAPATELHSSRTATTPMLRAKAAGEGGSDSVMGSPPERRRAHSAASLQDTPLQAVQHSTSSRRGSAVKGSATKKKQLAAGPDVTRWFDADTGMYEDTAVELSTVVGEGHMQTATSIVNVVSAENSNVSGDARLDADGLRRLDAELSAIDEELLGTADASRSSSWIVRKLAGVIPHSKRRKRSGSNGEGGGGGADADVGPDMSESDSNNSASDTDDEPGDFDPDLHGAHKRRTAVKRIILKSIPEPAIHAACQQRVRKHHFELVAGHYFHLMCDPYTSSAVFDELVEDSDPAVVPVRAMVTGLFDDEGPVPLGSSQSQQSGQTWSGEHVEKLLTFADFQRYAHGLRSRMISRRKAWDQVRTELDLDACELLIRVEDFMVIELSARQEGIVAVRASRDHSAADDGAGVAESLASAAAGDEVPNDPKPRLTLSQRLRGRLAITNRNIYFQLKDETAILVFSLEAPFSIFEASSKVAWSRSIAKGKSKDNSLELRNCSMAVVWSEAVLEQLASGEKLDSNTSALRAFLDDIDAVTTTAHQVPDFDPLGDVKEDPFREQLSIPEPVIDELPFRTRQLFNTEAARIRGEQVQWHIVSVKLIFSVVKDLLLTRGEERSTGGRRTIMKEIFTELRDAHIISQTHDDIWQAPSSLKNWKRHVKTRQEDAEALVHRLPLWCGINLLRGRALFKTTGRKVHSLMFATHHYTNDYATLAVNRFLEDDPELFSFTSRVASNYDRIQHMRVTHNKTFNPGRFRQEMDATFELLIHPIFLMLLVWDYFRSWTNTVASLTLTLGLAAMIYYDQVQYLVPTLLWTHAAALLLYWYLPGSTKDVVLARIYRRRSRNSTGLLEKYTKFRSVMGNIQFRLHIVNKALYRVRSLLTWQDPFRTQLWVTGCLIGAIVLTLIPFRFLCVGPLIWFIRQAFKIPDQRRPGIAKGAFLRFYEGLPHPDASKRLYYRNSPTSQQ